MLIKLLTSFENVSSKWHPEITHHAPGVPFILVGTKSDLRDDPETLQKLKKKGMAPVTKEEGEAKKNALKARACIECSALTQNQLKLVFDEAIRTVLKSPRTASEKKK